MNTIKTLTVFEVQGKRFDDIKEAEKYLLLCDLVDAAMEPLGKKKDDTDFYNGHGFVQHDPNLVATTKSIINRIASSVFKTCKNVSFLPRYADDSGVSCLSSAFYRLACINDYGKEYGQIYFAQHPSEVKP